MHAIQRIVRQNQKLKEENDQLKQLLGLVTQSEKNSEVMQAIQSNLAQYGDELGVFNPPKDHYLQDKDGVFTWKIPKIRQHYQDALHNEKLSLCSPVFRTSPKGYCLFIRVYLTGEGPGRGTHISAFFSIMKSANDHQLDWPFNHPLELTLMNCKNKADSITATLIPNPFPSFQRPDYEFNIASGFPEFAPVRVLMDDCFTRDDAITLQCRVSNAMQLL